MLRKLVLIPAMLLFIVADYAHAANEAFGKARLSATALTASCGADVDTTATADLDCPAFEMNTKNIDQASYTFTLVRNTCAEVYARLQTALSAAGPWTDSMLGSATLSSSVAVDGATITWTVSASGAVNISFDRIVSIYARWLLTCDNPGTDTIAASVVHR